MEIDYLFLSVELIEFRFSIYVLIRLLCLFFSFAIEGDEHIPSQNIIKYHLYCFLLNIRNCDNFIIQSACVLHYSHVLCLMVTGIISTAATATYNFGYKRLHPKPFVEF